MSRRQGMAVARAAVPAISGLAALVGVLADLGPPVQPVLVLCFVLVCPGLAVVGLLRPPSALFALTLAVAVSCALGIAVAEVLVYAGAWNPTAGLLVLVVLTVAAAAARVWLDRPRVPSGQG